MAKARAGAKPSTTPGRGDVPRVGPQIPARVRAAAALEDRAMTGDVSAIRALADGVADRLRGSDGAGLDGELPPTVAEAMIQAGLVELTRLGMWDPGPD